MRKSRRAAGYRSDIRSKGLRPGHGTIMLGIETSIKDAWIFQVLEVHQEKSMEVMEQSGQASAD